MENKTIRITKVSDTEIEIKETIAEKIIPAIENSVVISIVELKNKINDLNSQKNQWIGYLVTPQQELDKINARISEIDSQIATIQSQIDEAVAQGVVEHVEADPIISQDSVVTADPII